MSELMSVINIILLQNEYETCDVCNKNFVNIWLVAKITFGLSVTPITINKL